MLHLLPIAAAAMSLLCATYYAADPRRPASVTLALLLLQISLHSLTHPPHRAYILADLCAAYTSAVILAGIIRAKLRQKRG